MFSYDEGDVVRTWTDYEYFVGVIVKREPDVSKISGLDPGVGYEVRCTFWERLFDVPKEERQRYVRNAIRSDESGEWMSMVFPQECVTLL